MNKKIPKDFIEALQMFIFLLDDISPNIWIYNIDSIKIFCENNNLMSDYDYIINKMDLIYDKLINNNSFDESLKIEYFNEEF